MDILNSLMLATLHTAGGTALTVAGLCFAAGYIIGLVAGRRLGQAVLIPSIVVGVLSCLVRGYAAPLEPTAIAAVSVLHVAIGCLTVLILDRAKQAA